MHSVRRKINQLLGLEAVVQFLQGVRRPNHRILHFPSKIHPHQVVGLEQLRIKPPVSLDRINQPLVKVQLVVRLDYLASLNKQAYLEGHPRRQCHLTAPPKVHSQSHQQELQTRHTLYFPKKIQQPIQ